MSKRANKMNSEHLNVDKSSDSSSNENIDPNTSSLSKKRKISARRTDAQSNLLKSMAPTSDLNYVDLTLAWTSLSEKLNEIGPPQHPTSSWRKLWTSHKAKCKKRMTASECNDEVKQTIIAIIV